MYIKYILGWVDYAVDIRKEWRWGGIEGKREGGSAKTPIGEPASVSKRRIRYGQTSSWARVAVSYLVVLKDFSLTNEYQ